MPAVRTPGAPQPTRRVAVLGFCLPLGETGSATPITFDFGAITPFTCVPACNLSVYASQWLLPDTTQDSIRSCLAQALPRPPSQATELNALARRNPLRTVRASFPAHGSSGSFRLLSFLQGGRLAVVSLLGGPEDTLSKIAHAPLSLPPIDGVPVGVCRGSVDSCLSQTFTSVSNPHIVLRTIHRIRVSRLSTWVSPLARPCPAG